MPTIRKRAVQGRVLTREQTGELWLGPARSGVSAFANDRERKRAWEIHREEIMQKFPNVRRPWSWWHYERKMHAVTGRDIGQYLLDNNFATAEERRLIEQWRNTEEEAQCRRALVK